MASTLSKSARTELRAVQFLIRSGWRVLAHDLRIGRVQIDILARDPNGVLTIVEVKSRSPLAHLSAHQFRRLKRAGIVLAGYEPVQMRLMIAGLIEMTLLPVDALTV